MKADTFNIIINIIIDAMCFLMDFQTSLVLQDCARTAQNIQYRSSLLSFESKWNAFYFIEKSANWLDENNNPQNGS